MSASDPLDALLAGYGPPRIPAGLAERVAAAALAHEQSAALPPGQARGRDRRGAWLRRPLIAGGVALGLAFSGAVAATLAGVQVALPPKVQTVLADVPFFGRIAKRPQPEAEPPAARPRAPARPERAVAAADPAPEPVADPDPLLRMQRARAVRRWLMARRLVAERPAAGLPTPRADRVERMIEERLVRRGVLPADPAEGAVVREQARGAWHARMERRQAARRARLEAGGLPGPFAGPGPAIGPAEPAMSEAERLNRAHLREIRMERMRLRRAMRREQMRRWRERGERFGPQPTEPIEPVEPPPAEAPDDPRR